jgi:type VI secretion system protein ImpE
LDNARDKLREGNVQQALDLLKQDVRKAPRDARLRTFLFQMFCITGEWDRALTQLTVALELDPETKPMAETYRSAIRCEVLREKIFRGERTPTVFGDPGEWVPLLIEANRLLAAGQTHEAAKLRDAAFDLAPPAEAVVNGTACEWVADADPRLGPVLEAVVEGKYLWIPFHRIKWLNVDPPVDLRDQVWMPAKFTWTNDGEAVGLIPTRYPNSASSPNAAIQLARSTEWSEIDPEWSLPLGQRVLVTDLDEVALMEVRKISMTAAAAETTAALGTPAVAGVG